MGRPTKYKPEYVHIALAHAKLGAKIEEIAEAFQVNNDTITEWQNKHPEFSVAIKEGREEYDNTAVEMALRRRATGFMRKVQKLDKDGCIHEVLEEVPPDATSMIFWLKNRQPKRWRDKQEVEMSGQINNVISSEPLTNEEWIKKYARKS
jgi:hypothetical protein